MTLILDKHVMDRGGFVDNTAEFYYSEKHSELAIIVRTQTQPRVSRTKYAYVTKEEAVRLANYILDQVKQGESDNA